MYTAYRIARSSDRKEKTWGAFLPYAALILLLAIVNIALFMLPMAMRMVFSTFLYRLASGSNGVILGSLLPKMTPFPF